MSTPVSTSSTSTGEPVAHPTIAAGPADVPRGQADALPAPQRVPWSVIGPSFMREWGYPNKGGKRRREPEHVEVLGQNGSGKSYFIVHILKERARLRNAVIVVVFTKPDDETINSLGWPVIDRWPPDYGKNQVIFAPKAKGISKAGLQEQKARIFDLLNKLWVARSNVIIYFDEIAYVCQDLGLNLQVQKYLREGRALGITVIGTTQRPQGVTRYLHSEAKWTICFAPKDEQDAERMAEVLGSKRLYKPLLMSLNRQNFEFLIIHNLTGKMFISWIDKKPPRRKKVRRKVANERAQ